MFNKVLVPLDGSDIAEGILPYVSLLARGLDIPVLLLSVIEKGVFSSRLASRAEKQATSRLQSVADRLSRNGVRAGTFTASGRPAEEIVAAARSQGCGLIAMFHHGQNIVAPGVLGSVTDKVVHTSAVPVLTMAPERAEMYSGQRASHRTYKKLAEPNITKVMVPLDGSPEAEAVVPYVEELAGKLSSRTHLVRIVRPRTLPWEASRRDEFEDEQAALVGEATTYLEAAAGRLRSGGLEIQTQVLVGHPATRLIELARQAYYDIIAIATRPGPRWALGSVAESLLRGTGDPVLMVVSREAPLGR